MNLIDANLSDGIVRRATMGKSMRDFASRMVGALARCYVRYAPWNRGKQRAVSIYNYNAGWRTRIVSTKTRFGDRMALSLPDVISNRVHLAGEWEPIITRYVRRHLRPGDNFVDVGANIGYYTLLASRIVGPDGRVFAIEASSSIYGRLERNVRLNSCKNVTTMHVAASDSKGSLKMYLAGGNIGHSTTVASLASKEGMTFEDSVPADTLDSLVGRDHLRRARFIKIDVEGAEHTVLSPLYSSLGEFSDSTEWLLELSPEYSAGGQDDVDRIFSAFTTAGYSAYMIPNEYDMEFLLNPPRGTELTQIRTAPRKGPCDVVMSRLAH